MNKQELKEAQGKGKVYYKILVNGAFGSGKTYFAMTFPKWAYAMIEPHGITTAITNPSLMENMVDYEQFSPNSEEDIKVSFERLSAYLVKVRELIKKGEVETFILDNLTHFSHMRWMYIEKYERTFGKSGAVDTLGMFGALNRYLHRFILTEVITLPCHVIVPVHQMEEEESDQAGKRSKTGKIITNTLGGFRDDAAGYFNASIYLNVKRGAQGLVYSAQCLPDGVNYAKNNLGLPATVPNISYKSIQDAIARANPV